MRDLVHMHNELVARAAASAVDTVITLLETPTFDQLVQKAAADYDETPEDIEAMDPERFRQIVWTYFDKADEIGEAICGHEKRLNDLCRDGDTAAAGALLYKLMADYVRPHFAKALETERQERAQDAYDAAEDSRFEGYCEQ